MPDNNIWHYCSQNNFDTLHTAIHALYHTDVIASSLDDAKHALELEINRGYKQARGLELEFVQIVSCGTRFRLEVRWMTELREGWQQAKLREDFSAADYTPPSKDCLP